MPRTDILIFDGLAIQDGVPEDGLQHSGIAKGPFQVMFQCDK